MNSNLPLNKYVSITSSPVALGKEFLEILWSNIEESILGSTANKYPLLLLCIIICIIIVIINLVAIQIVVLYFKHFLQKTFQLW